MRPRPGVGERPADVGRRHNGRPLRRTQPRAPLHSRRQSASELGAPASSAGAREAAVGPGAHGAQELANCGLLFVLCVRPGAVPSMTVERGPRLVPVELPQSGAKVYANAKVKRALAELSEDMTLYHGVRFGEVAEAIYEQGRVDGRREVFEFVESGRAQPELKNRNPGRPAKQATKKAAVRKGTTKKAAAKTATTKKATAKKATAKKRT